MPTILHSAAHDRSGARLSSVDPRARILAAVLLSIIVVAARHLDTVGLALAIVGPGSLLAGLPARDVAKRLLPLNALMLVLFVLLPLSTPGDAIWQLGPWAFSREGLRLAVTIALKGNAVLLTLVALLGTMDAVTLGHALSHLYVPDKLTHLLLFTVRYLDVLHREYLRLRAAMKLRGFRPRMDRHTYRSLGYLVGMLLVRSLDRAERIVAAMKCRGFRGHFYMLDHFAFARRDAAFCAASAVLFAALVWMEYT
jgi:cobalt/nickel transport system permease protein